MIDRIPQLWRDKLADIRQFAPSAVIMGGALRDLDNGRPIKDVDIFTRYGVNWDRIEGVLGQATKHQFFEYGSSSEITRAASHDFGGVEFNIIELADGLEPLNRLPLLDFGICQIAFDGECFYTETHYAVDRAYMRFTLRRCNSVAEAARSHRRWVRLSDKYRGWELKIPDQFKGYWREASQLCELRPPALNGWGV